MTKLFAKKNIKKIFVSIICIVLVCIIGVSTTLHPNNEDEFGLGINKANAQTTVSQGWNPSSTSSPNSDYHLQKTVTSLGNDLYQVDVYAANIEYASTAEVFVIWDDSNSMNDSKGNWYSQESTTIKNFLKTIRPFFLNFKVRLSDFGGTILNNAKDTGWVTANTDAAINNVVDNTITSAYHWTASKFYKNLAIVAGENSSTPGFTSTTNDTVRIVLLVADGVVSEAAGAFSSSGASKCITYANKIKNYATIFTACIGGHSTTLEGQNLMKQLATSSKHYKSGTYVGGDFVDLTEFAENLSISKNKHFSNNTYIDEKINNDYFSVVDGSVKVYEQAFTGTGFSSNDNVAVANLSYVYSNGQISTLQVRNYKFEDKKCFKVSTSNKGYRLHLTYQIKAKNVISPITVNTHIAQSTASTTHDGSYIDFYDNSKGWLCIPLPGIDVTINPQTYTIKFNPNGGRTSSGSTDATTQTAVVNADTVLNQSPFINTFTLTLYSHGGTTDGEENKVINVPASFNKWAEAASGGGAIYQDKATVRNLAAANATKNLYALYQGETILPEPVRSGYRFAGWYTSLDEDGNGIGVDFYAGDTYKLQKNSFLHAAWIPNDYTLSYNLNGGTGDFPTQSGNINTSIIVKPETPAGRPTKEGFEFAGWTLQDLFGSMDGKYTGTFYATEEMNEYSEFEPEYKGGETFVANADTNTTIYAVWKSSVTTYANGGEFDKETDHATTTKSYLYHVANSSITDTKAKITIFNVPTRDGYIFKGWNSSSDGTGTHYTDMVPVNAVLYAEWEAVPTWTVTYNANGGTGSVPHSQVKSKDVALPVLFDTIPSKYGYTFIGWDTNSDAEVPAYTESGENEYNQNEDAVLYAIYELAKYNIEYDSNGGEDAPDAQIKTHGTDLILSEDEPTRDKYTFKGWANESDAEDVEYLPGGTFTENEDTILYAVWEKNKITVTYDYATNGGTSVDIGSKELDPDGAFDVSPVAVKEGWNFVGWGEYSNTTEPLTSEFEIPDHDITVYAIYKKDITANFYSRDWETPQSITTTIYNLAEYAEFIGPSYSSTPARDKYEEGKIQAEITSLNSYVKRTTESFKATNIEDKPKVYADEGTADFDAVYETKIALHYDSNGGEEFNFTSYMPIYRTYTPEIRNIIKPGEDRENYLYIVPEEAAPERSGYLFAGWYIPGLTKEYERHTGFPHQYVVPHYWPNVFDGDTTAYAQWLGNSITSNPLSTVEPGNEIEYTVKTTAGKASPLVQMVVNIPDNTTIVPSSIASDPTIELNDTGSGIQLIYNITDAEDDEEIIKKFKVRINDDVTNGDEITADLVSSVEYHEYNLAYIRYTEYTYDTEPTSVTDVASYNYKVIYNLNIGETGDVPVDNNEYAGGMSETAVIKNNTLSKEGYTFVGWLDRDAERAYREGEEITVDKNIELDALWGKLTLSTEPEAEVTPGQDIKYILDIEIPDYITEADVQDILPPEVEVTDVEFTPVEEPEEPGGDIEPAEEPREFTVTFDINTFYQGETTHENKTATVKENQRVSIPAVEADNNYEFVYWYSDNSYDGTADPDKLYNFNTPITDNITIYGIWVPKEEITYHTVSFEMGEHGTSIDDISVPDGSLLQFPGSQTDENYYILCWYTDDSFTDEEHIDASKIFNFGTPITEDITLYAVWSQFPEPANEPVVTHNDEIPGSEEETPSQPAYDEVNVHIVKVNGINKYRLVIDGRIKPNTAPDTVFTDRASMDTITGYTVNSNINTIQVKHIVTYIVGDNYTVEQYDDGSNKYVGKDILHNVDEHGNIIYYSHGAIATLIEPEVGEHEYFVSWNTLKNGEGVEFFAEDDVTLLNSLTVYKKVIYLEQKVENKQTDYIPGEEYNVIVHIRAPYTGKVTIPNVPELGSEILELINKNDEFIDEYSLEDGVLTVTINAEKDSDYEIKLKCKVTEDAEPGSTSGIISTGRYFGETYEINEDKIDINNYYVITYNANGGEGEVPVDNTYHREGEAATILSADDLSKKGYEFTSWNTKQDGTGDKHNEGSEAVFTSDQTLYATWVTVSKLPETGSAQLIALTGLISSLCAGYIFLKKRENAEIC